MTLDEASDIFDAAPSPMTAAALLREADGYFAEEMIGPDSFRAIVHQVADWLHVEMAAEEPAPGCAPPRRRRK